jgi:hypothetical protein
MEEGTDRVKAAQGPKGIGGWLILPLLGLIAMPIRLGISLINDFLPIFQQGIWEVLTTPGTDAYHHLWAPLLTFEIMGNLLFITLALVLLYLLLTKSPYFPSLFIFFLASNLVFVIADFFFADLIPAIAAQNDPQPLKEVVRTVIGASIWIPYMLCSKRVKNTFVAPDKVIERPAALAQQA